MKIAVRVDASDRMGSGHVMRCLSLANTLHQKGASVLFVCRSLPENLRELIVNNQHEVRMLSPRTQYSRDELAHSDWLESSQFQDADDTVDALSDSHWDWMIIDHYALDFRWESRLLAYVNRIFVIDDLADRKHNCSVLLDQNFYLDADIRYLDKVGSECKLLLGPKFALLRDEFREQRKVIKPRTGAVKRILIFLGGVDFGNFTGRIIEVLAGLDQQFHVDVVIGARHPDKENIQARCLQLGFICHIQTTKIAELMALADIAIGAGGSATWERCCLGLPSITLSVAENQKKLVNEAAIGGFIYAVDLSTQFEKKLSLHIQALIDNEQLRQFMSQHSINEIDGLGMHRVASEFNLIQIEFRRAELTDCEKIWNWRNAPENRLVSRQPDHIPLSDHQQWFERVLVDKNRILLIGYFEGEDIGVIRFDMNRNQAEISIYLVPDKIGKGWGRVILKSAEKWLSDHTSNINVIIAEVLADNILSTNLFVKSDYSASSIVYKKMVH